MSELALDMGGAIYAYNNSSVLTTFIVDRERPYFTSLSPKEGETVNSPIVTFSWDIYTRTKMGTPIYDLYIYYYTDKACVRRPVLNISESSKVVDLSEGSLPLRMSQLSSTKSSHDTPKNPLNIYATSELVAFNVGNFLSVSKGGCSKVWRTQDDKDNRKWSLQRDFYQYGCAGRGAEWQYREIKPLKVGKGMILVGQNNPPRGGNTSASRASI